MDNLLDNSGIKDLYKNLNPERIKSPIQLIALLLIIGMIILTSLLLYAAKNIITPSWLPAFFSVSSILIIFIILYVFFRLFTNYRANLLSDNHYTLKYLNKEEALKKIDSNLIENKSTETIKKSFFLNKDEIIAKSEYLIKGKQDYVEVFLNSKNKVLDFIEKETKQVISRQVCVERLYFDGLLEYKNGIILFEVDPIETFEEFNNKQVNSFYIRYFIKKKTISFLMESIPNKNIAFRWLIIYDDIDIKDYESLKRKVELTYFPYSKFNFQIEFIPFSKIRDFNK
ncbi:MAG: hypothetical protein AB7V50_06620 [Vampirovibrionia bacterium]